MAKNQHLFSKVEKVPAIHFMYINCEDLKMFCSIVSGSSGNASIIKNNNTVILIDCGLSGKRLTEELKNIGIDAKDITAMLITHEHSDHIAGAGVMSRRFNIPVFATAGTHKNMNIGPIQEQNIRIINNSTSFEIGDIMVNPFPISHDAADPVGYSFICGEKKYSVATDMGIMTEEVFSQIKGSEAVILEANHDVDMLMYGEYPYNLKRRILGKYGHMSNDLAAETAVRLLESNTKHIMLSHLSDKNNEPNIAYKTVEETLKNHGASIGADIGLCVAQRYEVTEFI